MMKASERIANPRLIRQRLGMNQSEFWGRIGVTQSGGSRYESGRSMPKPVRELFRLVHLERVDLQRIKKQDLEVIQYLKAREPKLYQSLKKAAKTRGNGKAR